MNLRLALYLVGVLALVAGSVTAMADQSGRLIGIHEIPPFVAERVELPLTPAPDRIGLPQPSHAAVAG